MKITWVGFGVIPAWFVFGAAGGVAEVLLTPEMDTKQRLEGVAVQVAQQIVGAAAFHRLMEVVNFVQEVMIGRLSATCRRTAHRARSAQVLVGA